MYFSTHICTHSCRLFTSLSISPSFMWSYLYFSSQRHPSKRPLSPSLHFPILISVFQMPVFVLLAGYYPNRWRPLIDEAPTVSGKHRLLPEGKTPAVTGKHQLPPGNHRLLPDNTNCYGKTQSVTGKATAQMLPGHQRLPGNPHGGTQIVTGKTQIVVGERKLLSATSVLFYRTLYFSTHISIFYIAIYLLLQPASST